MILKVLFSAAKLPSYCRIVKDGKKRKIRTACQKLARAVACSGTSMSADAHVNREAIFVFCPVSAPQAQVQRSPKSIRTHPPF